jgi:lysophospholipase L1-like esterase
MSRFSLTRFSAAAALAAALAAPGAARAQVAAPAGQAMRFADQIQAFQDRDKVTPPPREAILFIGSSLFRLWDQVEEQMAPLPVFNRGFGGSRTWEVLNYMDQIVFPYQPRIIVYYTGSNDVNAGEPADEIVGRFRQFAARVAIELPRTRIFFVSMARSPDKQARWSVVDDANTQIRAFADASPQVDFIDVNPPLHNADGSPRTEFYKPDGQHLEPPAYVEWARIVKPILTAAWSKPTTN